MDLLDVEGSEGFIKPLATLVFFAIFGYAYCTRISSNNDAEPVNYEFDPNSLKNKDVKLLRRMAEEIQREKGRIMRIEEKLKRFGPTLPESDSATVKTELADGSKTDALKDESNLKK